MAVVTPVPPAVTVLAARVQGFLGYSGFPTFPFTVSYGQLPGVPDFAGGWATPGHIHIPARLRPAVQSLAARYGRRGPLSLLQIDAARIFLHEGLHETANGLTGDVWQEGAVEAVARDLLPIFTSVVFGEPLAGPRRFETSAGAYEAEVRNVRQLSTIRSASASFTTYPARVWRRTFLLTDPTTRQAMAEGRL